MSHGAVNGRAAVSVLPKPATPLSATFCNMAQTVDRSQRYSVPFPGWLGQPNRFVVVSGFQFFVRSGKGRSSSRRLRSASRSARKGSSDRNASAAGRRAALAELVFRSALTPEHAQGRWTMRRAFLETAPASDAARVDVGHGASLCTKAAEPILHHLISGRSSLAPLPKCLIHEAEARRGWAPSERAAGCAGHG